MSIKLRLLLSNIALFIIPIILFCLASMILMIVFLGDFKEVSSLLPESHNYQKTVQEDTVLFYQLKEQSVRNPEKLMDKEYLQTFEDKLTEINATLLIRIDDDIYYSSPSLENVKANDLPDFGVETSVRNLEEVGSQSFAIKQHDFYTKQGEEISLFLMKDAGPWNKFVKTFFPILFGLCLLILIGTNALLTYFMSKSIIKPIDRLKTAAQFIKNGNLNHSIKASRNDEIGQLTEAFEEMRIQLNKSFEIQKQYEENRKELIAHISHDLKTPITSIKGYIEGIRDGIADTPEKRERYIQTIYTKSVDLDHLIDELFLYSKLDLGKIPFVFEIVDIRRYLDDYIEELSFELEKRQVEVNFKFDLKDNFQVLADREKFKRVIGNIVGNSIKYMDKELKILDISLISTSKSVDIIIKDNGPGIPEESLPLIFNQFYRAEQSRNMLTGGSGLGLSIARMIIEEHQGEIKVESKLHVGTTITISLPHHIDSKVVTL
jgi:histidine kinase